MVLDANKCQNKWRLTCFGCLRQHKGVITAERCFGYIVFRRSDVLWLSLSVVGRSIVMARQHRATSRERWSFVSLGNFKIERYE